MIPCDFLNIIAFKFVSFFLASHNTKVFRNRVLPIKVANTAENLHTTQTLDDFLFFIGEVIVSRARLVLGVLYV